MDIALVQDLSDLAPRLQDGHNNEAGLKEATNLLTKIDNRLKEQRESSFPTCFPSHTGRPSYRLRACWTQSVSSAHS